MLRVIFVVVELLFHNFFSDVVKATISKELEYYYLLVSSGAVGNRTEMYRL